MMLVQIVISERICDCGVVTLFWGVVALLLPANTKTEVLKWYKKKSDQKK